MKSIEFIYKAKTYYALIRTTHFETHSHHYITIMNGKLEAMFYGHHLFIEQDSIIHPTSSTTDDGINELKESIRQALQNHVQKEVTKNRENVEKYSLFENKKAVA